MNVEGDAAAMGQDGTPQIQGTPVSGPSPQVPGTPVPTSPGLTTRSGGGICAVAMGVTDQLDMSVDTGPNKGRWMSMATTMSGRRWVIAAPAGPRLLVTKLHELLGDLA